MRTLLVFTQYFLSMNYCLISKGYKHNKAPVTVVMCPSRVLWSLRRTFSGLPASCRVTLFNQTIKTWLRGKTCRLVTIFPGITGVI